MDKVSEDNQDQINHGIKGIINQLNHNSKAQTEVKSAENVGFVNNIGISYGLTLKDIDDNEVKENLEIEEIILNDTTKSNVEEIYDKEPSTSDCDEEETITGNLLTNKQEEDLDNVSVNNIKNIGKEVEDEKDEKFNTPVINEESIKEEIEENPFCDTKITKDNESFWENEYSDAPLAWEDEQIETHEIAPPKKMVSRKDLKLSRKTNKNHIVGKVHHSDSTLLN